MQLTGLLIQRILANLPTGRLSKPAEEAGARRNWPKDIDRLIKLDGKTPAAVREMIEWATADTFWRANILSAAKLRGKWDQLEMAKKQRRGVPAPAEPQAARVDTTGFQRPELA